MSADQSPASSSSPGIALVTGGTRGIGFGIARALANDRWDLVLTGLRSEPDVRASLEELESLGSKVDYFASDISVREDRSSLVERIRERHGALNAIVNNAGRGPAVRADLLDASEASFETLIRTNLQGPYFLTQQLARDMVSRRLSDPRHRSAIVFVT